MTATRPTTLRLLLWPTLITLAVSILRLTLEVQGPINTASGGGGAGLGIVWLVFVFGAIFGWRLRRAGSAPRVRFAWLWSLALAAAVVGIVVLAFRNVDPQNTGETAYQTLRTGVLTGVALAIPAGLATLLIWPRLAWVLLLYALPARLTVIGLTWLAKVRGWDTHYTKLGPAGIERDLAETMSSITAAQIGFWIPFTLIFGGLVGCLAATLTRPRSS